MGKNWKGPGGGRGGRGGRGGGGSSNDTSSCKGHGAIMGTCDAARERETSKEMVNLLNQAIETLYPATQMVTEDVEQESWGGSVKDMLAQEISQVRKQKHSATQNVMSVDTKVKGIVMIKIMRKDLCALELVKAIFDRVRREKEHCSRHVVRIIPLQRVFFPDNNNLSDNIASIVLSAYPGAALPLYVKEIIVAPEIEKDGGNKRSISEISTDVEAEHPEPEANESADSAPDMVIPLEKLEEGESSANKCSRIESPASANIPEHSEAGTTIKDGESFSDTNVKEETKIPEATIPIMYAPQFYSCVFKARSHNIMTRETVQATVSKTLPSFLKPNFKRGKAVIVVEAFRNICGATLLKNGYEDYEEFNLKKFQTTHCSHTSTSNLVSFKPTIKAEDEDDLENTHDSADADLEVKSESTANILTTPAG